MTRIDARWTDEAELVVVCTGAPSRPALGAVRRARERGRKVGFLRLLGIWPFPIDAVRDACSRARAVLVPEMSLGQLNRELERHLDCPVRHFGRIGGVLPRVGELAEAVEAACEEVGA